MSENGSKRDRKRVEHYDAQYANFAADLYRDIRLVASGEDIGQNGWLTADEQDLFISWLDLSADSRLLDIACGSGGPSIRIAEKTGCAVHGVDAHAQGIDNAVSLARDRQLGDRVTFERLDASRRLPFSDGSFDAIVCIDAVNHLPDREAVFAEWARLLVHGGRLVFTDPVVVTGALTAEEIAVRSSIGFFLFVPPETDGVLLEASGFEIVHRLDCTENMARIAARWGDARVTREHDLRTIEGDETFEGQQEFFDVAARIARQRRLSRFAYLAVKPS